MRLNPFQFIWLLKQIRRDGGMRLCEQCIKDRIEAVTAEDKDKAYAASMSSGMYKVMETEQPCFVCNENTHIMVMVKDAMSAIKRASNKTGQV